MRPKLYNCNNFLRAGGSMTFIKVDLHTHLFVVCTLSTPFPKRLLIVREQKICHAHLQARK